VRLEDKVCPIPGAGSGIGQAMVSRVLNQKPEVESATPERILRIMEEHGFAPSIAASGLAAGRRLLLGVLYFVGAIRTIFLPVWGGSSAYP